MTESAWKVVMDEDGLTITGDSFSLSTTTSDPGDLDSVVSALQGVARASYGQYCGLSRAIEAVGERWGMLVVRDLLVNPKSTAELHEGLPGVPMNLLAMRIKEMAYVGILERSETVDEAGADQYRLTEYGRGLEDILLAFGRWGSAMLAEPRAEDIVTEDSMMVSMRSTFLPEAAAGQSARFQLHFGEVVIHVVVEDGELEVGRGPLLGAPRIEPGPTMKDMLTREISVDDAIATGTVKMSGDQTALHRFISMFALPYQAAPQRSSV